MSTDETAIFQQLVSMFDAPAFMRRAREVEHAWEQLQTRCRRQRDEWLALPRLRLARLHALLGDWSQLTPELCPPAARAELVRLFDDWRPTLRVPVSTTTSRRAIRAAFRELCESFARFNARWNEFLTGLDLAPLNRLRDGYNRYYVLEKECALRSARNARDGFTPLSMVTPETLLAEMPLLPVPNL